MGDGESDAQKERVFDPFFDSDRGINYVQVTANFAITHALRASNMTTTHIYETVCRELAKLAPMEIEESHIRPENLLVEDLGIDSMKFASLTVGLESNLGIENFPMQRWIDDCVDAGRQLSVAELVLACVNIMGSARR